MKRYNILFLIVSIPFLNLGAQVTHEVKASGFDFTPAELTISVGDIVKFNVGSSHPVLEVEQATWDANGSDAKTDGFAFPSGDGSETFNETGTYYYICTNHISSGMKGKIVVQQATSEFVSNQDDDLFSIQGNYLQLTNSTIRNGLTLQFYTVDGKLVKQVNVTSEQLFLPNILEKGIYLIVNDEHSINQKIIVQ